MSTYRQFEDLPIGQEARRLALEIHQLTFHEFFIKDFALLGQIRNSAGSVMNNIAEGFERDGKPGFINFLSMSKGSAGEARSQLYRAFDLKSIGQLQPEKRIGDYERLSSHIANFIKYLNQSDNKGNKFKNRV